MEELLHFFSLAFSQFYNQLITGRETASLPDGNTRGVGILFAINVRNFMSYHRRTVY